VFEVVARLPQQFQYADVERTVLALVGYNQPGFAAQKTKSAALSLAEMRFGKNMII